MKTILDIYCELIRKAVDSKTVAVEFDPNNQPKYVPSDQAHRTDKKAIIKMPCQAPRLMIDQTISADKIRAVIERAENLEEDLVIFSHEYGHHLTDNPGYDAALERCLTHPVVERDFNDMLTVINEAANTKARTEILEYCRGVLTAEPKKK